MLGCIQRLPGPQVGQACFQRTWTPSTSEKGVRVWTTAWHNWKKDFQNPSKPSLNLLSKLMLFGTINCIELALYLYLLMYPSFEIYSEDYTLYNFYVLSISLSFRQKQWEKALIISQNESHWSICSYFSMLFLKVVGVWLLQVINQRVVIFLIFYCDSGHGER